MVYFSRAGTYRPQWQAASLPAIYIENISQIKLGLSLYTHHGRIPLVQAAQTTEADHGQYPPKPLCRAKVNGSAEMCNTTPQNSASKRQTLTRMNCPKARSQDDKSREDDHMRRVRARMLRSLLSHIYTNAATKAL